LKIKNEQMKNENGKTTCIPAGRKTKNNSGLISLTTVLVIGSVIIETAIVGLAIAYLVGEQGMGVRASYAASAAAESGVEDVLLRLERDKGFTPTTNPYTVTSGLYSAQVTITKTILDAQFSQYTIQSIGSALTKRITLQKVYVVNETTGSLHLQSSTGGL